MPATYHLPHLRTLEAEAVIAEHGFDAAFGGARRDEERARAKDRILSFRDEFGQWEPQSQRPEVWSLYNGWIRKGEHARVVESSASTLEEVVAEIAATEMTERGQTRADDKVTEAAMEDRKRQGYL